MNQKGFANIILIVVIVALAITVGYLVFVKKSEPVAQSPTPTPTQTITPTKTPMSPAPIQTTCTNQPEGNPVITSLSTNSGSVGTKIEIKGCNFSGFEGDKNAWIENSQGIKGIFYGETGSTSNLLKVTLKQQLCQKDTSYSDLPCNEWLNLVPETYKIYVMPWGKKSNEINFTIK